MLKKILGLTGLAVSAALMFASPASAELKDILEAGKIKIATPENFPPFGSLGSEGEYEGYDITGSAKVGGFGLLVDYFPMGGAFHLSGGAFKTDYGANGTAQDVEFNGYTTDVMMNFTQKSDIAPVAAMGWDWQVGKHGTITADLGAIFGSGFDLEARESSGMVPQSDVDAETADIREAAAKVKVLPYVKIGVGFKF